MGKLAASPAGGGGGGGELPSHTLNSPTTPVGREGQNIDVVVAQSLEVVFTKLNMGADLDPAEYRVSLGDCERLGRAVADHPALTVSTLDTVPIRSEREDITRRQALRVRRSQVEALRAAALLRPLTASPAAGGRLALLDLSHCPLGDQGALAVAGALGALPALETLLLVNAKVGAEGARGLAFAMAQSGFAGERLDLRLNPLGELGGQGVAALLRRNLGPRALGLAATDLGTMAGLHLAEALHYNCRLQALTISSNPSLGEPVGGALVEAMAVNTWLLQVDARDSGLREQDLQAVEEALAANRLRHRQAWERQQQRLQEEADEQLQELQELQELQDNLQEARPLQEQHEAGGRGRGRGRGRGDGPDSTASIATATAPARPSGRTSASALAAAASGALGLGVGAATLSLASTRSGIPST
ncbi:Dynein regulatory complex subunit 5 [Frankliniella fusca]|uniref:Dynein regulatory complex subunit 5 n=1 Tax=Frankliniella fusca TaxID=407009 RepID=A0AAE1HQ23_9NEOP|nr:Dynein regulatory complex subunit 5 [Frankliniella fusca]